MPALHPETMARRLERAGCELLLRPARKALTRQEVSNLIALFCDAIHTLENRHGTLFVSPAGDVSPFPIARRRRVKQENAA